MSIEQSAQPYRIVIVGGGSAGSVLANRLTERPGATVTLVEAGPDYGSAAPDDLMSSDVLGAYTGSDWGFTTEPGIVGHPIAAYRGKAVGGSSAVNGSVMVRALPSDFERWTALGLNGWTFDDALPYYRKLESSDSADPQWHGHGGPIPVHQLTDDEVTPMQRAFIGAAEARGIPRSDDFNGPSPSGVGPYPMNVVDGRRINAAVAYLTDAVRSRAALIIEADSVADRVLFTGDRATGVLLADGRILEADEVILSAGTYGSAAILLRSGIGPVEQLAALGIDVVRDLPVGSAVVDHPFYYVTFAARPDLIGAASPVIGAKAWIASSHAAAGELDLHLTATHLVDQSISPTGAAFVIAVALVRPSSRGSVSITDTDPYTAPRIDLNFLADETDRIRLVEGIELARHIGRTEPLASMVDHELSPGVDARSQEQLLASVYATLDTYHHPTSSAPMGPKGSEWAVVDEYGLVHGVAGLRVTDASILPDVPQAATNPTVIMLAEKAAAHIGTELDTRVGQ